MRAFWLMLLIFSIHEWLRAGGDDEVRHGRPVTCPGKTLLVTVPVPDLCDAIRFPAAATTVLAARTAQCGHRSRSPVVT
jgi:hypothetical protein